MRSSTSPEAISLPSREGLGGHRHSFLISLGEQDEHKKKGRCHGHLPPLFPSEVRWSDDDHLPKKRKLGGNPLPFLDRGRVKRLRLHQLHLVKRRTGLHVARREGQAPWSPPSSLPSGKKDEVSNGHPFTEKIFPYQEQEGGRSPSSIPHKGTIKLLAPHQLAMATSHPYPFWEYDGVAMVTLLVTLLHSSRREPPSEKRRVEGHPNLSMR